MNAVIGELYPAIIADAETCVGGVVFRDVPDAAWERLDRFEGRMYVRQRVQIEVNGGTRLYAQASIVKSTFTDCLESVPVGF